MQNKTLMVGVILSCLAMGAFAEDGGSLPPKKNALTIGLLQGGGGILGFDYERLLFGGVGVQVGVGFPSVEAGLMFHLNSETTNSNAIWLGWWNQGSPGSSLSATYLGISYVMRGWGWLNGQLGFAYLPFVGQELKDKTSSLRDTRFALLYSLGWYTGF